MKKMDNHSKKFKKQEFIRIIAQALYSLGYKKSANCLESESGVKYKSQELEIIENLIKNDTFENCIKGIQIFQNLSEETRNLAIFMLLKDRVFEYMEKGDMFNALSVLRKEMSVFCKFKDVEKVHQLAFQVVCGPNNLLDVEKVANTRKKIFKEVEKMLPVGIIIPEGRLVSLVEKAVEGQVENCVYHNSDEDVSVLRDHRCARDKIPTDTVQVLTDHQNEVWFVQFSNNGQYLASASSDCTAIIWKVLENGELTKKHTLQSHQKPVSFVAWSPDDTMLLTCGNIELLKLWDTETGACKYTFANLGFSVSSCAWFPDSKRLVCGSSDVEKGIHMWDCEGNELKAWKGSRMPKILDLAVTPDGENLISIFSDKDIRILNLSTNLERVISEEHPITSLSVSADSKFLMVNLNSQEIHMWDVAGKWIKPLKYTGHMQHKYVIRSCFGGLNSKFIASGSENSQVYIWNRGNPHPIEVLSGHSMTVNCVSWNPKRPQMLASASDDQTIRIWGPKG